MSEIEILHSPGCDNAEVAIERVREVVATLVPETRMVVRDIAAEPEAASRFAGSPTVLVDGGDLEPDVDPAPGAG